MKNPFKWIAAVFGVLLAIFVTLVIIIYPQLPKSICTTPELQTRLFERPAEPVPVEGKFIYRSASELAMIRSGDATSVEVVKEHIAHIKNNNWRYNAVV